MNTGHYVTLRGIHSFHMVDRHTIREVEVGARHTRIFTPFTIIEVENRYNQEVLNLLCKEPVQELSNGQEKKQRLYPRLADLPF
jgi:hypothetical protein